MISLGPVLSLVALVTTLATAAAVRAVSGRAPRTNRRRHRLAAWLSVSPTLWRGPSRVFRHDTGIRSPGSLW